MPQPLYPSFVKQANASVRNAKVPSIDSNKSGLEPSPNPNTQSPPPPVPPAPPLYFPLDLDLSTGPHTIMFRVNPYEKAQPSQSVYFPCPANITFNDSATYNTIDLNTIGGTLKAASDIVKSGQGEVGLAAAVLREGAKTVSNIKGADIASATLSSLPIPLPFPGQSGLRAAARNIGRTIFNPNTNTTFEGNAIRAFTFSFKMVSTSDKESRRILEIHRFFRKYAYADSDPKTNNLFLKFPPSWTISFMDKNGAKNDFVPEIFDCYLVSLETTFNSTTNTFHGDGAPLEVDINLSYQETRVLNRADIENANNPNYGVTNNTGKSPDNQNLNQTGTEISVTEKVRQYEW